VLRFGFVRALIVNSWPKREKSCDLCSELPRLMCGYFLSFLVYHMLAGDCCRVLLCHLLIGIFIHQWQQDVPGLRGSVSYLLPRVQVFASLELLPNDIMKMSNKMFWQYKN